MHRAAGAVDNEVAAGHQQRRDATDLLDEDIPFGVDVGHDEADLIGMRGHHDVRAAVRADIEPHVAQRIAADLTERGQAPADHFLDRRLEPCGARGEAQRPQQFDIGRHGSSSQRWLG